MTRVNRITTSEAASILGCSRQHVVNLCDRGELASVSVGSHRRLRRDEVASYVLRRATGEMTRDQLRSLWLHRAVAGRIAAAPDATLQLAEQNARKRLAEAPASGSARSLRRWLQLIEQGPESVMGVLTSSSNTARELRQNSPFAGVLGEPERRAILDSFQRSNEIR